MLDIWVDIITLKILNMARDGYGLDTRLHNDYVDEIKNKTKDNILHFLAEHDAEIRRQTIEEVKERMQNEISFTRIQKRLMIYILDKMKGDQNE